MFFSLTNLLSTAVTPMPEPWTFGGVKVPPEITTKDAYRNWSIAPSTDSSFISAFEGITAEVRVNEKEGNSPYRMHALIVDYDAAFDDHDEAKLKVAAYSEFLPAYAVRTFSNGLRLVWLFETVLPIITTEQAKRLLVIMKSKLSLTKWHGGLDTSCLGDPGRYYHIGRTWIPLYPKRVIPKTHLRLWLYEASQNLTLDQTPGQHYKIPMEKLAAEVEARFPGRWDGEFTLGRRGVRFWDPTASDRTAAIVCEEGMLYFTDGGGFKTWKQLFGPQFVEAFEADRISELLERTAYDGREFWVMDNDRWAACCKEDFSQDLRVRGFDSRKGRTDTYSEIDKIENTIKKVRRVDRALPFMFMPPGIIRYEGKTLLNISCVKAIAPSPPVTPGPLTLADGPEKFPFLYNLLKSFFTPPINDKDGDQLYLFLAWLKYFYQSAYERTPGPGQALVIAGPPGKGKTLLSRRIVGGLVGGFADASQHLAEGAQWTEELVDAPVLSVDDSLATNNPGNVLRFSNMVKQYVSNARMMYNQKFKQTGQVPWFGRIIITTNCDSLSMRILPEMDMGTRDKISLFMASESMISFPPAGTIDKVLCKELPVFARFLLDWNYPPETQVPEQRFGRVKSYQHPMLMAEALEQGESGMILELLAQFLPEYQRGRPEAPHWSGTATMLFKDLAAANPGVMAKVLPKSIGPILGILKSRGYPVYSDPVHRAVWHITYDLCSLATKKKGVVHAGDNGNVRQRVPDATPRVVQGTGIGDAAGGGVGGDGTDMGRTEAVVGAGES